MEIVLCILLGVWTLVSAIAVVYRISKDFNNNARKENNK